RSAAERRLLGVCGGTMALAWTVLVLGHSQPALVTPLLRCAPDCPRKAVQLDWLHAAGPVAGAVALAAWFALTAGTLVLLWRRLSAATPPVRRVMGPAVVVASGSVLFLACFYV